MKILKAFLTCIVAVAVVFVGMFALATQAGAASVDDLTFELNRDGESYTVTDCDQSASGALEIPGTYDGKPVTAIAHFAFSGCTNLTSVTIGYGVTSISIYAFSGCSNLTSITIPNSVTKIGNDAFSGCTSLAGIWVEQYNPNYSSDSNGVLFNKDKTTLLMAPSAIVNYVIPDSVTSISQGAFSGCTNLESITIPFVGSSKKTAADDNQYPFGYIFGTNSYTDGIKVSQSYRESETSVRSSTYYIPASLKSVTVTGGEILYGAFSGCSSLASITIPDSVTSIGQMAFYYCSSLTSISLPDGVTNIGDGAFVGCSSLTGITIPAGVTSISNATFNGCSGLKSFTFPDGVTKIASYAFKDCSSLTDIVIPAGVTDIGGSAFEGCSGLISITIPDANIGNNVFKNCSIKKLTIADGSEVVTAAMVMCRDTLEEVIVPDSVTVIGASAFENCSSLTSVTLGKGLVSIGDSAFEKCNRLDGIVLPDGLINIGNAAFVWCDALTAITIPDKVTSIGDSGFWGCINLTSVTLGKSVASIGKSVFVSCRKLTSITIPDSLTTIGDNAFYECDIKKVIVADGSKTVTSVMIVCKDTLEEVILPNSLTSIGANAFWKCSGLTSIVIPDGVTSIGYGAFCDCTGLRDLKIPDTVTSIGDDAFAGCTGLCDLKIPDGVTSIGSWAFSGCIGLTSMVIPNGVTSIGDGVFSGCTGLTSMAIPNGVTSIGEGAFSGCIGLTSMAIPKGVTSIGSSAFANCAGLTSIVIPSGVTNIEFQTFKGCSSLATITIPDSVTSVSPNAFEDCFIRKLIIAKGAKTVTPEMVVCKSILQEVIIPDSVTSIDGRAFEYCRNLTSITLPGSVSKINSYTLSYCPSLTNLTIPEGVTRLETRAFDRCTSLTSVTIPVSVTSLGEDVFFASVLTDIYYAGSEEQWEAIISGHTHLTNSAVLKAKVHYHYVPSSSNVTRVFGSTRYDTAFKAADMLKAQLGVDKFDAIVVACGTDFADALSGSYLANQKNAPILLVRSRNQEINQVKDYIKANLKTGGTVYLLGGTNAIPKSMETGLDGYTVKRLAGATRYETSLAIIQEAGVGDKDILVCTGKNFADGLSASAVNMPIMLVKDSLSATQKAFLSTLNGNKIVIIGGTSAVNTRIENALKAYGTTERIEGATRYYTSVNIAKKYFPDATCMVVAYADNFPDGLSGGALAYSLDAPLILTMNGKQAAAVSYATEKNITSGVVLGGSTLISDKTVKQVFRMGANEAIQIQ